MSATARRSSWPWLLALSLLLGLAFQGSRGLWDPDEGRYANVALQMVDSGDYLVPRRNDDAIHVSKPPVTYWTIAGSTELFGRNEWALRLPMAIAYVLTVLMVLRLGRRFVPEHPWLPALFYAASPVPFIAASTITTDTLLACAETAAVLAYVEFRVGGGPRRWLDAMWALFGLAFMVKGPPGLLPLLAIVGWEIRLRSAALLRPLGLLAFLAVGGSWFAWLLWRHPELLGTLVGQEVIGRVISADSDRHGQWYGAFAVYLPTLALGVLPWAFLAAWQRRRLGAAAAAAAPQVGKAFLWAWLLAPLAIFALARSRLPLYLLPLFVPICLLLSRQFLNWTPTRGWWAATAAWLLLLLAGKAWVSIHPSDQDARQLARELERTLPAAPGEVVFVGTKPRYGLRFYLDAEVEAISFSTKDASGSRPDDDTLAHEFSEHEPGRVFVVPSRKAALFENAAAAHGVRVRAVGTVRKLRIYAQ
jgi:4-amino-4-deoxy-L-arabinose transferase-like glycosyltransferase